MSGRLWSLIQMRTCLLLALLQPLPPAPSTAPLPTPPPPLLTPLLPDTTVTPMPTTTLHPLQTEGNRLWNYNHILYTSAHSFFFFLDDIFSSYLPRCGHVWSKVSSNKRRKRSLSLLIVTSDHMIA